MTFLPFLWKPEEHVFLKPTMISTFAERVGHHFASVYRPDLDTEVYDALLDLAGETRANLADMAPRDMIDIQSFMWTVVEYKYEDKASARVRRDIRGKELDASELRPEFLGEEAGERTTDFGRGSADDEPGLDFD